MTEQASKPAVVGDQRPLSPHLSIYRPQITWVLSILHRIMGMALALGTLLLVYWLVALAAGSEHYARAQGFFGHPLVLILLLGWCFAFCFHLLNGIRHLFWDAGRGFALPNVTRSGIAVVIGSLLLTALLFGSAVMKGL